MRDSRRPDRNAESALATRSTRDLATVGRALTAGSERAPGSRRHPITERGHGVMSDDGGDEALELEAEREPAGGVEHQGASGDMLVDGDGVT